MRPNPPCWTRAARVNETPTSGSAAKTDGAFDTAEVSVHDAITVDEADASAAVHLIAQTLEAVDDVVVSASADRDLAATINDLVGAEHEFVELDLRRECFGRELTQSSPNAAHEVVGICVVLVVMKTRMRSRNCRRWPSRCGASALAKTPIRWPRSRARLYSASVAEKPVASMRP